MVRHRFHMVFALGRFNEGVQWFTELNQACRNAGCVEGKLWTVGFGTVNEVVAEYDYPDTAAMDADVNTFQSTSEIMAVFRRGTEIGSAQHWPWDEMLIEAPSLA